MLNAAQSEAVGARDDDILCLACAGAGKTRTLVERIAHAIETDTPPWAILAVTFTNKAADEMRERLGARVGKARAAQVWMGTFHALAARLLRDFCHIAEMPDGFSIYDEADRLDVCLMVAHEMGLKVTAKSPSIEGVIGLADRARRRADFDRLYGGVLRRNAATDYDGLELHLLALLQSPAVRAYVQRFREVMVDEYQDTNDVQERILEAFRGAVPTLRIFRVGDPSQAIFGFRGANPTLILDAAARPGMRVIRLDTNYRSGRAIVDAGNRIAAHTGSPLGTVQAGRDVDGDVSVQGWDDGDCRSVGIAQLVQTEIADGRAPGDIMILARTWKPLLRVEAELTAVGIPCEMPKREADAWNSPAMRWLVAAMRLHRNPRDGIALRRVLRWPMPAASDLQIARAEARGVAIDELRKDGIARLPRIDADTAGDFAGRFAVQSDAWEAMDAAGLDAHRDELDAAVDRLKSWTARREADGATADAPAFLNWYHFRDVRDAETAEAGGKVRLLTIHAAKGLEAPVIHFVGPDLGVFPKRGEDVRGEELRLWYVAVTRARDVLVAHTAREIEGWSGDAVAAGPGPFCAYLERGA